MEKNPELPKINIGADYNQHFAKQASLKRTIVFISIIIVLILLFGLALTKTGLVINKIFGGRNSGYLNLIKNGPIKDPNKISVLILGLRGEDDPHGGLLTDSLMILSIRKNDGKIALASLPRDLYIQMPGQKEKSGNYLYEKINFAYALGRERLGKDGGIIYSKAAVSSVIDLYLDYAIVIDFTAFQKIVDVLGGITVYLNKPFEETSQFNQEFLVNLPAGENYLDGKTALYYARSRFSTSDFDRARRQQEILLAIKNKALSTGILFNPVKLYSLLNTMGNHVRTDMTVDDFTGLVNLYSKLDFKNIKRLVFDTTPQGLLYSTYSDKGTYILLPVGDNFDKIHEAVRNIFNPISAKSLP